MATITNSISTNSSVFIKSTTAINFSSSITTTPVASSVATVAFGSSLTAGTAVQNTTGYNLLVNVSIVVTAATGATITMGVGPTNTPTKNTVISSFSVAETVSFCALVPNSYYLLVDTTGTIVVSSITTQSCPF